MAFVIWALKGIAILAIFHFLIPSVVHVATGNSWSKLPAMLVASIVAAAFMAWLEYAPFLLFFLWIGLMHYTLKEMEEGQFQRQAGMAINKPVFYASCYSYVVLSCVLAWLLQAEIVQGGPDGPGTPLWKYLFGLD